MTRARNGRWLTELEALFVVKEEERRADEWRRKLEGMGTAAKQRRR